MTTDIKRKILIADDSPTVVDILKYALEESGCDVVTAHDGLDAMEKIYTEVPEVLLLDLMMPKMDGYKVCRILKDDKLTNHILVVMLTAKDQFDDRIWKVKAMADEYLIKSSDPFAIADTLIDTINKEEYVSRRSSSEALESRRKLILRQEKAQTKMEAGTLILSINEKVNKLLDKKIIEPTLMCEVLAVAEQQKGLREVMEDVLVILRMVFEYDIACVYVSLRKENLLSLCYLNTLSEDLVLKFKNYVKEKLQIEATKLKIYRHILDGKVSSKRLTQYEFMYDHPLYYNGEKIGGIVISALDEKYIDDSLLVSLNSICRSISVAIVHTFLLCNAVESMPDGLIQGLEEEFKEMKPSEAEAKKVLVVDNDENLLRMLKVYIDSRGYKAITTHTAEEAINLLRDGQQKIDIILMDVMMPGMSGWTACKKIKQDPQRRNIPIILMSAWGLSEDYNNKMAEESGTSYFISKPLNFDRLFNIFDISTSQALKK